MKKVTKVIAKKPNKQIQEAVSTEIVIASIEKKAGPAFKKLEKITAIKTHEDYNLAADQIKLLKEIDKTAKAEESLMADPIKLALERIKNHFTPFHNKVKKIEAETKSLMLDFLESNTKKIGQVQEDFKSGKIKKIDTVVAKTADLQIDNTGSAKIRKVWELSILNADKIPKEYLVPDESAIIAAFKEGKTVAGCKYEQVNSIAI